MSRSRNCLRTIHMRRSWPRFRGGRGTDAPSAGRSPCGQRRVCRDERITERWNMPRRSIWNARKRAALLDLPTDEADLLRHYTLSDDDIEHIRVRRKGHNRLGFALQLCAFRYPGRIPAVGDGHFPGRPSLHCRTARHACRRPQWLCGAGGDPEGTPGRTSAHLRLQDVHGALRPGPEGLARERGGRSALE